MRHKELILETSSWMLVQVRAEPQHLPRRRDGHGWQHRRPRTQNGYRETKEPVRPSGEESGEEQRSTRPQTAREPFTADQLPREHVSHTHTLLPQHRASPPTGCTPTPSCGRRTVLPAPSPLRAEAGHVGGGGSSSGSDRDARPAAQGPTERLPGLPRSPAAPSSGGTGPGDRTDSGTPGPPPKRGQRQTEAAEGESAEGKAVLGMRRRPARSLPALPPPALPACGSAGRAPQPGEVGEV